MRQFQLADMDGNILLNFNEAPSNATAFANEFSDLNAQMDYDNINGMQNIVPKYSGGNSISATVYGDSRADLFTVMNKAGLLTVQNQATPFFQLMYNNGQETFNKTVIIEHIEVAGEFDDVVKVTLTLFDCYGYWTAADVPFVDNSIIGNVEFLTASTQTWQMWTTPYQTVQLAQNPGLFQEYKTALNSVPPSIVPSPLGDNTFENYYNVPLSQQGLCYVVKPIVNPTNDQLQFCFGDASGNLYVMRVAVSTIVTGSYWRYDVNNDVLYAVNGSYINPSSMSVVPHTNTIYEFTNGAWSQLQSISGTAIAWFGKTDQSTTEFFIYPNGVTQSTGLVTFYEYPTMPSGGTDQTFAIMSSQQVAQIYKYGFYHMDTSGNIYFNVFNYVPAGTATLTPPQSFLYPTGDVSGATTQAHSVWIDTLPIMTQTTIGNFSMVQYNWNASTSQWIGNPTPTFTNIKYLGLDTMFSQINTQGNPYNPITGFMTTQSRPNELTYSNMDVYYDQTGNILQEVSVTLTADGTCALFFTGNMVTLNTPDPVPTQALVYQATTGQTVTFDFTTNQCSVPCYLASIATSDDGLQPTLTQLTPPANLIPNLQTMGTVQLPSDTMNVLDQDGNPIALVTGVGAQVSITGLAREVYDRIV